VAGDMKHACRHTSPKFKRATESGDLTPAREFIENCTQER
jgi:hypothetical protein